ncbi:cupredoxin domain-containing protein [Sphaerotilus sp.]|uniref:cupredoxin domain-containing protein n=1 Tax=Sphaerotilus sp. TaxID=2093942 RepID=UPI0034E1E98A
MSLNAWTRRTALLCLLGTTGLAASLLALPARAADIELTLVIRDHRFDPAELKVPAGQRVKLVVDNQDKSPEEFESKSLKREKVIPGGAKVPVLIGPLQPGRYPFYGEYHEATARGVVIVE